jgi:heat shock protein HslJ
MLTHRILWLALFSAAACAGGAARGGNGGNGGWLELDTEGTGPTMHFSGSVHHLDLEGGVFVIRDADGTQYNPINLPKEYQVEGTPVDVEARERADMAAVGMVGPLIEILRIRKGKVTAAETPVDQPAALPGTSWRLGDVSGAPAIESIEATLEFQSEGTVSGNASCNTFRGPVTIEANGGIKFGALATTRKLCPGEKVMQQEAAYLAALAKVERFELSGDSLTLSAGGRPVLRFVRAGK